MAPHMLVGGRLILTVTLLAICCSFGCGRQPQVSAPNRRLIESLKTAVMAKNLAWLDENAQIIARRHGEGTLSDSEFAAFDAIVRQAQAGDWAGAQYEITRLAKAQAAPE